MKLFGLSLEAANNLRTTVRRGVVVGGGHARQIFFGSVHCGGSAGIIFAQRFQKARTKFRETEETAMTGSVSNLWQLSIPEYS
jgi:hypothetical protein